MSKAKKEQLKQELLERVSGLDDVFDTHAHLCDRRFAQEGISEESLLATISEMGVKNVLIPADSLDSSIAAVEYVRRNNGRSNVSLYASVGVHPHEASTYSDEVERKLIELINNRESNRIVALGEIGLDYYYDLSPRDVQKDVMRRQLELAYELDIPIILHERDAAADCIDILQEFYNNGKLRSNPGVCHCCSCSVEISNILLKMGFYLGFDGPITFENNVKGVAVLKNCPIDRIVIETDSPYLTPVPYRGRTNHSGNVVFVLEKISEYLNIPIHELNMILSENARRLYEL